MPGQVVANGPISFSDAQGRAFSIPLSLLYFDANGAIQADTWPLYGDHQALLDDWLPYLQEQGLIREGEAPAPVNAMVVKAKTPGAAGNTILLNIDNVHPDPADNTVTLFDATVIETNTYIGLAPDTVKLVLGTAPGGGSKPGLVFVSSAGDPELPKVGDYPLASGGAGVSSTVDIPNVDESATALSVTARSEGAEGDRTTVTIDDVDATNTTFTLTAEWTKTVPNLEAGELAGAFDYEITVDPPAGGALAAPAAGEYALSGGADAQTAQPASVTLVANPQ
jgi:hypothetical protein